MRLDPETKEAIEFSIDQALLASTTMRRALEAGTVLPDSVIVAATDMIDNLCRITSVLARDSKSVEP